ICPEYVLVFIFNRLIPENPISPKPGACPRSRAAPSALLLLILLNHGLTAAAILYRLSEAP
ncbi:MAG TPA: hypothetical protein VMG30_13595, partial [Acidobacteriota bacterium]|nr:hypothetical protein [Acidobacteriota bacterium]